ncbi:hypothetical protein MBBWO_10660 [Methanobrevibacter woesei]|uniref:PD-(D/E)XK nuclease family transposase n=1 Tax=Methanobrevibacter woesei TaxID=190976 RepID=A0A2U1S815_9EURY|nr:hypothetical protein [Methanobrevibacter woesei]PWB86212.1 hypothetical protein MBBWO_10660 [Methanobrevibacter woesei]
MVEFFDKNNQIVEELSTEFITTDPVYRYADKVLKNDKNEIIIVEYQNSKLKSQDIKRFMVYTALAIEKQKSKVRIFILYTYHVKTQELWDYGPIIFKPEIFSLKEIEGDKVLKRLKEKIKNKKTLTRQELHELRFLPFFKSKEQPKEILKQTVKLTNELTEIEQETLETLKKGQAILARRFIEDEKEFNLIMEKIKMKTNVFRELVDEGIEEGERKGRNEGIETVAKRMKKQNYPIEEIMNLTKLTKKEIENL